MLIYLINLLANGGILRFDLIGYDVFLTHKYWLYWLRLERVSTSCLARNSPFVFFLL